MAKTDKQKEDAKKAKEKKAKKANSAANSVKKDLEAGKKLNTDLGFDTPLSRLDPHIPEDQRRYIEAQRALTDPSSPAFVGARSEEEKSGLGILEQLMKDAGTRSGDVTDLLAKLKTGWEKDGERTADTADVIERARNQAAQAGQRSAEMQSTLDLMKSGLAGLNAQENQALREQAQREVDRKRQAAIEAANSAARTGGLRGGARQAALRGANRDAMAAQADLEQKNLLSNIDIQDRRRSEYANVLGTQEDSEFGRGNTALNTLGNFVGSAETRESQRMQSARDAYRDQLSNTERDEFDRRSLTAVNYNNRVGDLRAGEYDRTSGSMRDYNDALNKRNDYFLETAKTNLGQERTERAAQITGATGLTGLIENERQRRKDARRNKGDGRDRANNRNGNSTPAYDPMNYYNEVKNIYSQSGAI